MVIDIISYTDTQYAALSEEQILEVQQAQLKKNRLLIKLEEDKRKEKYRLIENGVFLSKIWDLYCEKLQKEYDNEVENIRESLLFYLRFTSKTESDSSQTGPTDAPYTVDYSLTMEERFYIVKEYYETTYTNGKQRYDAFLLDKVAIVYLGELYAPLHDYLYELGQE